MGMGNAVSIQQQEYSNEESNTPGNLCPPMGEALKLTAVNLSFFSQKIIL